MPGSNRVVTYLDDALMADFEDWVAENYGEVDGNTSKALRLAVRELLNDSVDGGGSGDLDELHDKLDEVLTHVSDSDSTHTHKQSAATDVDKIVARAETEGTPLGDRRLEDLIIETRGLDVGDDRTLKRWKRRIRQSGQLYQLPENVDGSVEWTDSVRKWMFAIENQKQPVADALVDKHGLTDKEYDEILAEYHPDRDPFETGATSSTSEGDDGDVSQNGGATSSTSIAKEAAKAPLSDNGGATSSTSDDADPDEVLDQLDAAEPARTNGTHTD